MIGKWFYGTDLPAAANGATYIVSAGSLFGNNSNAALDVPSSADMRQGALGDCYFIAALGTLADSDPSSIENMFINNGVQNGVQSWTVRFYYDTPQGYTADYVTVNALLPGYAATAPEYAQPGADGGWWIPLLEKAYAQWNQTGNEGRNGQNSYASLTGGWMDAVDEAVLGAAAADYSPSATGAAQAVIAALEGGAAVTAGIFTNGSSQFTNLNLVSGHAYQVASYNNNPQSANYGTFQLANPWGTYEPQPLTWSELAEFCPGIVVAGAAASAAPSSGTVGSAAPPPQQGVPSGSIGGDSAASHAARAAIQQAVSPRRYVADAAILASFVGSQSFSADDGTKNVRTQALDALFAEYGS